MESVSETADEQTRALLHERVVFIADPATDGSYAQYILCDRRLVAKIPDIDDDNSVESNDDDTALPACSSYEGASIPIAGCTALESLEKVGLRITSYIPAIMGTTRAGEGKRLLIVGGSGGVGSWITQLARSNYPKLSIVCTVGSEESAVWCKKMGCSGTIGHDEIETLGGGPKGSCDYIICLTEPTTKLFASIAEVLRPYGKICLVVAGEGIKKLDMSFIFFKCGTVSTETVFSSIRDGYHLDQAGEMAKILKLMKQGRVTAPMSEDWDDAKSDWNQCNEEGGYIDLVGSGHTRGKFVMKIGE